MKFYPTLQETLAKRFTELDECQDIINHGIMAGYDGFTYTYELNSFFEEFETEIEDYFDGMFGNSWMTEICQMQNFSSMDEMRAWMCYVVAEDFCSRKVDLMEVA